MSPTNVNCIRCTGPRAALFSTARVSVSRLPRKHRQRLRASLPDGPMPEGEGELIDHLRSEILRKQKAEAEVDALVEREKQNLQDAADELKEQIDALKERREAEMNDGFDKAMAEIDAMSSDIEKKLERAKKQRKKDDAEFFEWEENMTRSRNEGQFFKNLYKPQFEKNKKKKKDGDDEERDA